MSGLEKDRNSNSDINNNHPNFTKLELPPPPSKIVKSNVNNSGPSNRREFFSLDEIEYEESTFDLSQPQAVYRSLAFAPNITIENGNNDLMQKQQQAIRNVHLNKIIAKTGFLTIDSPAGKNRGGTHIRQQHLYDLGSPACKSDDDDYDGEINIPYLPPYPFKLEKNTHVSIASNLIAIDNLVCLINENLNQTGADFHFSPIKGKWKGAVYKGNRFVNFRIYIYKTIKNNDDDNKCKDSCKESSDEDKDFNYIIEFQRRHGEPLQYTQLWKGFITELQRKDLIKDVEANNFLTKNYLQPSPRLHCGLTSLESPTVGDLLKNKNKNKNSHFCADDDSNLQEYAKPLVEMCQSPSHHLNLEALRSMAELSSQEDNHNLFERSQAIDAIAKLLHCPSAEVRQFSASVLSNLSESNIGQNSIVEVGAVPSLLKILTKASHEDSYAEIDMQREAARTLANLCKRFSKEIMKEIEMDKDIFAWVSSANTLDDERLRTHACQILKVFNNTLDTMA